MTNNMTTSSTVRAVRRGSLHRSRKKAIWSFIARSPLIPVFASTDITPSLSRRQLYYLRHVVCQCPVRVIDCARRGIGDSVRLFAREFLALGTSIYFLDGPRTSFASWRQVSNST